MEDGVGEARDDWGGLVCTDVWITEDGGTCVVSGETDIGAGVDGGAGGEEVEVRGGGEEGV